MKHRLIRSVRSKKYYGIITAVSSGVFTVAALTCVCGICISKMDVPDIAVYAASCFVLGMSGYISGYIFGRNKRRQGILSGLKCGLLLWGIVSVFGIVYMRSISFGAIFRDLLFLCIPAIAGGVYGVNSKLYRPPYN
ncbi:MAG: TIGR04086 family membrane protein [Porcipelethomonas sp.]